MSGWTKLFSSLVTSSVWCESHATLRVWVAMLATVDANGIVEGSVPGFANLARVSLVEMRQAIEKLSSPDPDSRTPDHEGRRIEAVPGGWRLLNYAAYRDRGQAKEGSRAPYFRERRRQQQEGVARNTQAVARNTEAAADSEEEAAADSADTASPSSVSSSRGFLRGQA